MSTETDAADSELQLILDEVYQRSIDDRDGALADYSPEIAKVDAERLAIATAKGHFVAAGDCTTPFTQRQRSQIAHEGPRSITQRTEDLTAG